MMVTGCEGSPLAPPVLPPLIRHSQSDHSKKRGSLGQVGQKFSPQGNDDPSIDTFFP